MAVVLAARRFVAPRQAVIAAALSSSQTQAIVTPSLVMRCAVPTGCQPPSLAVRGISTASATASLPGILRAAASVGALPSRNAGLGPSGVPGVTARAAAAADSKRTLFGYKFQRLQLDAIRRTSADLGTSRARKARAAGLTPGTIYGDGADGNYEPIPILVRTKDLVREHNRAPTSFPNSLIEMTLSDDAPAELVIPRSLDVDPVTRQIRNVTFLRHVPDRKPGTRVSIPFRTINDERCTAYKAGGWMLELVHRLPLYCWGDTIPDSLVLDLRGKGIGDRIMASEIHLPDGLRLRTTQGDFAVARFAGSKRLLMQREAQIAATSG